MNKRARIALRVNPDVDAKTHPYISTGLKNNKFGVDIASAERLYRRAATMDGIEIDGIASHIGSQLLEVAPFSSEEHTSELQSLMRISYAVFCLKKNKQHNQK